MSLKQILKNKEAYINGVVDDFDKVWGKISPQMQRAVKSIFKADLSADEWKLGIEAIFENNGYNAAVEGFVSKYSEMARFSKEMADEIGYKFLLTEENIRTFDKLQAIQLDRLTDKANYVNDMRRFAIESELQGDSIRRISSGLETIFDNMGRRLNTEIYTGIRTFEAGLDKSSMENAGVERFVYAGPVDNKNRDVCTATLSDPRQSTGWTMKDIEESDTPFITRGNFNCRHRWLPFVEET